MKNKTTPKNFTLKNLQTLKPNPFKIPPTTNPTQPPTRPHTHPHTHPLTHTPDLLKDSDKALIRAEPDTSLLAAVAIMSRHSFSHLPVLEPHTGNILYVLTARRVLKFLASFVRGGKGVWRGFFGVFLGWFGGFLGEWFGGF